MARSKNRGGARPGTLHCVPGIGELLGSHIGQTLPVPSIFKIKKDSAVLRKENGRGNIVLQGCVLYVLTMQKETDTSGSVVPRQSPGGDSYSVLSFDP